MADDAEMTLIPSNTEPATGSAAAEPPKQDTTNIFGRFKKKLLFAEETVVFFKIPAVALALTADCALAAEMPKDFQGTLVSGVGAAARRRPIAVALRLPSPTSPGSSTNTGAEHGVASPPRPPSSPRWYAPPDAACP